MNTSSRRKLFACRTMSITCRRCGKTADMMVTDLIEGDYYQSKEPGVFCVANETPFAGTASNKVYMMSKDNPALLKKVNQWLDSQDKEVLKRKWKIRG